MITDPKYKQETLKSYNNNSESYAKKFDGAFGYHQVSLERFLSKFSRKSEILDLGAGAGTYGAKMRDAGHYVLCLDNSVEMLNICSSRKLQTQLMDMERLNLGRREFDAVWTMTGITHIPKENLDSLLRKVAIHTKRDGLLFIGVHEGDQNELVEDTAAGKGVYRHMSKFMPGEIEKVARAYFKKEEHWRTEGYGGVQFLNYLFRKY